MTALALMLRFLSAVCDLSLSFSLPHSLSLSLFTSPSISLGSSDFLLPDGVPFLLQFLISLALSPLSLPSVRVYVVRTGGCRGVADPRSVDRFSLDEGAEIKQKKGKYEYKWHRGDEYYRPLCGVVWEGCFELKDRKSVV